MDLHQDPDFLLKVFNRGLLFTVDPSGKAEENETELVHMGMMAEWSEK